MEVVEETRSAPATSSTHGISSQQHSTRLKSKKLRNTKKLKNANFRCGKSKDVCRPWFVTYVNYLQYQPKIFLTLGDSNCRSIFMSDICKLILSICCRKPVVPWALVQNAYKIKHIVVIALDSMGMNTYRLGKDRMPFLSEIKQVAVCKSVLDNYVCDGMSSLLRCPKKICINELRSNRDYYSFLSFLKNNGSSINHTNNKLDQDLVLNTSLDNNFESILSDMKNDVNDSVKKDFFSDYSMSLQDCMLSLQDMQESDYPLDHRADDQYVVLSNAVDNVEIENPTIYAIDCEMCLTTKGVELLRVSIVDRKFRTVYDSLVKPQNPVLDFHTMYHGITKDDLNLETKTFAQVQKEVLNYIKPECVLVGHSMENDLKALKIIHHRVIDTALLYRKLSLTRSKHSLKFLAKYWLNEGIQTGHHDPGEDARTAMKLFLLKMKFGSALNSIIESETLCEILYRAGKRAALVDSEVFCKTYSGPHTNCFFSNSDDEVIENCKTVLSSCIYDFVFLRINSLKNYHEKQSSIETDLNVNQRKNCSESNEFFDICQDIDAKIKYLFSLMPNRSLVIITGGHENKSKIAVVKRLMSETSNFQQYKSLMYQITNLVNETPAFFTIKSIQNNY